MYIIAGRVLLFLIIDLVLPILNVSANCTLGRTDREETTSCPDAGLYIDMDQPASCSGQVTHWDLCYYSPNSVFYGSSLPIELQVWRFNDVLTEGVKVASYEPSINIPSFPERFQCISIGLNQDDYMDVTAGDFLGVWLYPNLFLPMVKRTLDFRHLLFAPPVTFNDVVPSVVRFPTASNEQYFSAEGVAMHLTANIAALPVVVGNAASTSIPSVDHDEPCNSSSTSTPKDFLSNNTQTITIGVISAVAGVELVLLIFISVFCIQKVARMRRACDKNHDKDSEPGHPERTENASRRNSQDLSHRAYHDPTVCQYYDSICDYSLEEGLGVTQASTNISTAPNQSYHHNITLRDE